MFLLGASLLNRSVGSNGTQRHSSEHGTKEGDENDEECLPHSGTPNDVEKPQENEHTCNSTENQTNKQMHQKGQSLQIQPCMQQRRQEIGGTKLKPGDGWMDE